MLTPAEINTRLPVWAALSELFIDNELTVEDKSRIAYKLKGTKYQLAEIIDILEDEVLPTFSSNLRVVAGSWTGWSDKEVQERITNRLNQGVNSFTKKWRKLNVHFLIGKNWQEVQTIFSNISSE